MQLKELNDRQKDHSTARRGLLGEVSDFFKGDFYRDGAGFDGPPPIQRVTESKALYDTVLELIPTYFTSKDMVRKACERHDDGVLGQEPKWHWINKPLLASKTLEDNRDDSTKGLDLIYTQWWDDNKIKQILSDADVASLWAYDVPISEGNYTTQRYAADRVTTNESDVRKNYVYHGDKQRTIATPDRTSSVLRLYIPKKYRQTVVVNGKLRKTLSGTFEEILNKVRIQALRPEVSGVIRDDDSEPLFGYYEYELNKYEAEGNTARETEISVLVRDAPDEILQLVSKSATNEDFTIHCLIRDDVPIQASVVDLKGKLHFYELSRKPLITASSLSLQRKINLISTILSVNAGDGIGMKALMNVLPPAQFYRITDTSKTAITMSEYLQETDRTKVSMETLPYPVGNGAVAALQGSNTYDGEGNYLGPANPSLQKLGPVETMNLREDRKVFIRDFYEEVDQPHMLSSSDGDAGEASRKQMFAVFQASLNRTASPVEGAIRWALESSRDFAAHFSKDKSYNKFKVYAQTSLMTYISTTDEKRADMELSDRGYIAHDTARSNAGISDVDAEKVIIANQDTDPVEVKKQEVVEREQENLDAQMAAKQKTGSNLAKQK